MTKELLEYFNGDELAGEVWLSKYAKRDKEGTIIEDTPDDMHKRLAKEFWRVEEKFIKNPVYKKGFLNKFRSKPKFSPYWYKRQNLSEERIYSLFKNYKYVVPAGSVMAGLGSEKPVSLSNCFVLPSPEDSYSSINLTRLYQTELMKRRGGVGYDLSNLRPRGASVNNAAVTSTGAASFMDVCSDVTNEVAQQGRRGALMISMGLVPDIQEFIEKKQDLTKVTGANVSVQLSDDFMEAVEKDEDYILKWPYNDEIVIFRVDTPNSKIEEMEYGKLYKMWYLKNKFMSRTEEKHGYCKKVKAKELWQQIIHCAWNTAEPGIIFKDRMHNYSPDGIYPKYKGVATNPCGEIYMSGNESCRLLSLNLLSFVDNQFTENAEIDFELLYNITYEAMRIGDDLVELENEAVQKIINEVKDDEFALRVWTGVLEKSKNGRRVGLGFTALSDMIAAINLKFCTEEANEIVKQVCQTMNKAVLDCQSDMAIERGRFPDQSIGLEIIDANDWYDYIHKNYYDQYMRIMTYGRRNIASTSIAPAGTISTQTRTSSGIEPAFMPYYTRRKKCVTPEDRVDYTDKLGINFTEFVIVHPQLQKWAEINMKDYMDSFSHLGEKEWEEIYKKSPWFGACAQDIDWQKRVELQGIVQRELIQHSISSTCNLPNDVTEEEVSNIYMTAWKEGLKGITVYRDGCREGILVKKEEKKEEAKFFNNIDAPKRPKSLPADFYVTTVKGDKFFVMVGLYEEKPYEVFIYKVKEGEKTNYNQHRGVITKVKRGYYTYKSDELVIENISSDLTSEEYALALMSSMLMRHGANIKFICKTVEKIDDNISSFSSAMRRILMKYIKDQIIEGEKCPDCGGKLARENGCIHCLDCGWSKCG